MLRWHAACHPFLHLPGIFQRKLLQDWQKERQSQENMQVLHAWLPPSTEELCRGPQVASLCNADRSARWHFDQELRPGKKEELRRNSELWRCFPQRRELSRM